MTIPFFIECDVRYVNSHKVIWDTEGKLRPIKEVVEKLREHFSEMRLNENVCGYCYNEIKPPYDTCPRCVAKLRKDLSRALLEEKRLNERLNELCQSKSLKKW